MAAFSSIMIGAALIGGGMVLAKSMAPKPKMPDMPDPKIERAKAEAEAAQKANSALAVRNRARKASSLLAKDAAPDALGAGQGKTTLGQ
jgi:hypothetical protein